MNNYKNSGDLLKGKNGFGNFSMNISSKEFILLDNSMISIGK
jgi:hypothetical protein